MMTDQPPKKKPKCENIQNKALLKLELAPYRYYKDHASLYNCIRTEPRLAGELEVVAKFFPRPDADGINPEPWKIAGLGLVAVALQRPDTKVTSVVYNMENYTYATNATGRRIRHHRNPALTPWEIIDMIEILEPRAETLETVGFQDLMVTETSGRDAHNSTWYRKLSRLVREVGRNVILKNCRAWQFGDSLEVFFLNINHKEKVTLIHCPGALLSLLAEGTVKELTVSGVTKGKVSKFITEGMMYFKPDEGSKYFSPANDTMVKIDFSNIIGDNGPVAESVLKFLPALKHNKTLRRLSIDFTGGSSSGGLQLEYLTQRYVAVKPELMDQIQAAAEELVDTDRGNNQVIRYLAFAPVELTKKTMEWLFENGFNGRYLKTRLGDYDIWLSSMFENHGDLSNLYWHIRENPAAFVKMQQGKK